MNVNRGIVDKYFNGYFPQKKLDKKSKKDNYYGVIKLLLSKKSKQRFYNKRVLWQYLKDNHGLECSQSAFRAYIARKPEFQAYFSEGKRTESVHSVVLYETLPGEQTQLRLEGVYLVYNKR